MVQGPLKSESLACDKHNSLKIGKAEWHGVARAPCQNQKLQKATAMTPNVFQVNEPVKMALIYVDKTQAVRIWL